MDVSSRWFLVLVAALLVLVALIYPSDRPRPAREASETVEPTEAAETEATAAPTATPAAAETGATAGEGGIVAPYEGETLEVLAKLNAWRIDEGLWPFKPNATLDGLALQQAEYILSLPSLPDDFHAGEGGSTPKERALAVDWPFYNNEDQIAITEITRIGPDSDSAIDYWMNSQVHHDSVVDPSYREIGIATLERGNGLLFVAVLGARPDVLPALLEPESGDLYLSNEEYRWAVAGDNIKEVTQVQTLESTGSALDPNAWVDWGLTLPAPAGADQPFYVAYTDGEREVTATVRPNADIAWLPGNLSLASGAGTAAEVAETGAASVGSCPDSGGGPYDLIPFEGAPADHPDYLHGDLNLSLRGYSRSSGDLALVDYSGATDANAPRLNGLFEPSRVPTISTGYQVNQWIWDPGQCGGAADGCRGDVDDGWDINLAGFETTPGEAVYAPERGPEIYPGGYVAMVLYAEETRITINYTRDDTVASGYSVQIENVCVDPDLVELYRAQVDGDGNHASGELPALRNNQALGTAIGDEVQVAIRDKGAYMDPRSRKDWWE